MTSSQELAALSRQVAEAIGWRFEFAHTISNDGGDLVIKYYRVYKPTGELVEYSNWGDDEWAEYHLDDAYPDYATDANAATEDCKVDGYMLRIQQTVDGWKAYYVPVTINAHVTIYGHRIDATEFECEKLAEAVCRARKALAVVIDSAAAKRTGEAGV